jgi:hypothetical protein
MDRHLNAKDDNLLDNVKHDDASMAQLRRKLDSTSLFLDHSVGASEFWLTTSADE